MEYKTIKFIPIINLNLNFIDWRMELMGFQDKKIEESKTIEVIEDLVSNGQNNIISSIDKALTTEWEKVAENKKRMWNKIKNYLNTK